MLRAWLYRFARDRKANAAVIADQPVRTGRKPVGLKRFVGDTRGNIAVIFAIACIPLLSGVGCAIDYALATRMKSKLQSAADAAAVGAISQGSPAYVAAGQMGSTGPVTAGNTDATNIFNANISGLTGYNNLIVTPSVTKTNTNITSAPWHAIFRRRTALARMAAPRAIRPTTTVWAMRSPGSAKAVIKNCFRRTTTIRWAYSCPRRWSRGCQIRSTIP